MNEQELNARYMEVLDELQSNPTDALRAEKTELASQIVAIRQAQRQQREAETDSLPDGNDGIAKPKPVEGSTEVSA